MQRSIYFCMGVWEHLQTKERPHAMDRNEKREKIVHEEKVNALALIGEIIVW